jgi:hypothetical protein
LVGEIRPLSDHIDEPADLGMVACARFYAGEFDKAQKAEALLERLTIAFGD